MDIFEAKVLLELNENLNISQRELSVKAGIALGSVNKAINRLCDEGFLNKEMQLTKKGKSIIENRKPQNAIILAAGYGMRMVPINMECSKAFLEVKGEPLIERLIKQLHEVGIYDIRVVVGYMKEKFEYLIDDYGVELCVNAEYSSKNNLHSLSLVANYLKNTYIIPCDIWSKENPFSDKELYSWYMVSEEMTDEGDVRVNRKGDLVAARGDVLGNRMIGISYLLESDSEEVRKRIEILDHNPKYANRFWEECLYDARDKMIVKAKIVSPNEVYEINTFEQLRELDEESNHLNANAIKIAAKTCNADVNEITDIEVLKKGMTNRSFVFRCKGKRYIMRIPGEGTDKLINREEEAAVYGALKDYDISDNVKYINPVNGYKITEYLEGTRVCDSNNLDDVRKCMSKLKELHKNGLKVDHEFSLFGQIDFYESLWGAECSIYKDYNDTKEKVMSLKKYIDAQEKAYCLTHIDAVPDNFLFTKDGEVRLIDWEYSGMQDPHVDIAMFCIYALYDREHVDQLIDVYFEDECPEYVRTKIYCYIAVCGLLWSNWCEFKRNLGVDFGEYALRQYRYAKEYYRIAVERMGQEIE